jgi:O-antigen/teichoic acid export membrane protein
MHEMASSRPVSLAARLYTIAQSVGIKHSLIIAMAMTFAGSVDYLVHIVVGRWLPPVEYGIFIAVTALVQLLIFLSTTIRSVVGFYTAELVTKPDSFQAVTGLVRQTWRWAWQWGAMGTAVMVLLSPYLTRELNLPSSAALWAASLMVLMLFLRQVTHGVLQGIPAFTGLGVVLVLQALLRVGLAVLFVWVGTRAVGALAAQSLSCGIAAGAAVWWLRRYFRKSAESAGHKISLVYPVHTFLGLAAFGVLTNLDALFVKHYFTPLIAGNYGPVTTLAKVSLFLPWALGFIILPKVKQRQASGQDTRPVLLLALAAALAPGLLLTGAYVLAPGALVKTIFGSAYTNPGNLLALANLAATLYAGLYVWLNYALALDRPAFVYASIGVVICQALSMFLVGRQSLVQMALAMISAALLGHFAGFLTTWSPAPARRIQPVELAASQ